RIMGIAPTINFEFALIMHPIGAVGRTNLCNMIFILLSVVVVAIVVATAFGPHHVSFGSFTRDWIAKESIAIARERAEQSRIAGPMKQFLIVVLPDGRVVNPLIQG